MVEDLTSAFFFDIVESDGILKCVPRGNESVEAVPEDEDQAIFAGIISFYFGQRAMAKVRSGK